MSRIVIGVGTEFFYNKCRYKIVRSEDNHFVCKNLQFEVEEKLSVEQLLDYANVNQLIFKNLKFCDDEEPVDDLRNDFSSYSEDEIEEAQLRLRCIEPLIHSEEGELTKSVRERVDELRCEGIKTSRSRLYEWRKKYLEGGFDIRFLVSKRKSKGGPGVLRTNTDIEIHISEILNEHYLVRIPKKVPTLHKLLKAKITHLNVARKANGEDLLICPSKRTLLRRVKTLDRYEVAKAQFGPLYVYSTQGFVQQMERPTRPLQFVQIDSTPIDLIFVHDESRRVLRRAYFTAAIDVFSRLVIGFNIGFDKPGYKTTMLTLRNAIAKKNIKQKYPFLKNEWPTFGIPETIILDNGPEFDNKNLRLMCKQLGITPFFCRYREPWTKGIIERFLQTFNYQLNHVLPGTTFANTKTRKDKEYDSEAKAVIGFSKYLEIFHEWLIDVYQISFHEGLEDIPIRVWEEGIKLKPAHVYHDPYTCSIILLPSETRTIQNDGIQWHNLQYQSEALWKLRNDRLSKGMENLVLYKYDPDDISKIYVEDLNGKYIEVLCTNQKYSKNLNLEMHLAVRKEIGERRQEVDDETAALAFVSIMEKARDEVIVQKKYSSKNSKLSVAGSNSEKSQLDVIEEKAIEMIEERFEQRKTVLQEDEETIWGDAYIAN